MAQAQLIKQAQAGLPSWLGSCNALIIGHSICDIFRKDKMGKSYKINL